MKLYFSLFILGSFFFLTMLHADTYNGPTSLRFTRKAEVTINGPATIKQASIKTLVVNGPLDFYEIEATVSATIAGYMKGEKGRFTKLQVTGPFYGHRIDCGELNVVGPVEVSYLKVTGDTTILGPLTATEAKFNNIIITADKISLNNATVNNLLIKKTDKEETQTLILTGSTVINGDVTFESGNGIIHADSSVVIHGSVKGTKQE